MTEFHLRVVQAGEDRVTFVRERLLKEGQERIGVPKEMLTDQGTQFTSELMAETSHFFFTFGRLHITAQCAMVLLIASMGR